MSDQGELADVVVALIQRGDVSGLRQVLTDNPAMVSAPLGGRYKFRTPMHVVTDWPGYFPNGPEVVRLLVELGADPDARQPGEETPLHWAASSDDAHVAAALIDAGADINALDGSIGTPLANAVGYCCWEVARLLVARGAQVDEPWQAAALGLLERLEQLLGDHPSPDQLSQAFWHACSGGQRRAAEHLLARGADRNWIPEYAKGTPVVVAAAPGTQRDTLVDWLRVNGARGSGPEAANEEIKALLDPVIARLGDRERLVLSYYYEGLSFSEIGEKLGVSLGRVGQIHAEALVQLRAKLS